MNQCLSRTREALFSGMLGVEIVALCHADDLEQGRMV
jgi:hypothetical protein